MLTIARTLDLAVLAIAIALRPNQYSSETSPTPKRPAEAKI